MMALVAATYAAYARKVDVDTYVVNPGNVVSVALAVDDLSDVGAATFVINYDSTIVACLGVDEGAAVEGAKMTYADTGAGQIVMVMPSFMTTSGVVARVRFLAREGTAGQFSDVTVAVADFCAKDGVTDLSVKNPVSIKNGMVRVVAADAAVERLENEFCVWPKTTLRELTLEEGDAIMASDDGCAVMVAGAVKSTGSIKVNPPLYGWQTGRYEILKTPTTQLEFNLRGVDGEVEVLSETVDGLTCYYADIVVEGSREIVVENGTLEKDVLAAIRASLGSELSAYPGVSRIVVKGDVSVIPVAVDLGIKPGITVSGVEAHATYEAPTLKIIAFNPETGLVRIKVTPGTGNIIKSQLVTGCIHVYGTSNLSEKMRYISGTKIDVTEYLDESTKGEADLTVTMGANTFLKVKAETETKKEGDTE